MHVCAQALLLGMFWQLPTFGLVACCDSLCLTSFFFLGSTIPPMLPHFRIIRTIMAGIRKRHHSNEPGPSRSDDPTILDTGM